MGFLMRRYEHISTVGTSMKVCDPINMPFLIVTQNLIIRPLLKQDRNEIMQAIRASLSNIHMWLPWTDKIPLVNEFANICQTFYDEAEQHYAYHFVVYQNEKFMGMCSLAEVDITKRCARLDYWCRSSLNNPDYFIEALTGILKYTFESSDLEQIYINCMVGNYMSEIAAKKLNFKLTGVELINNTQIKLYSINNATPLPSLDIYSVVL